MIFEQSKLFQFFSRTLQPLRTSLRLRLSVLVAGMLLAVVIASTLTALVLVQRTEAHKWEGRQTDAVQSAAGTVEAFLQRMEDSAQWISLLSRSDLDEKPQLLDDVLLLNPNLLELVRTDAAGRVVASAYQQSPLLTTPANMDAVYRLTFQVSGGNQTYVGVERFSGGSDSFLVYVSYVPTGGAVIGRLRMDVLWEIVSQIRFGETGNVFIMTRAGTIIADTDRSLVNSTLPASAQSLLSGEAATSEYTNIQAMPVVAASAPIVGTDWIVVAEMQSAEAYAETRLALTSVPLGASLVGLVLMMLMQVLLEHSIFDPVARLREGAERIGEGQLGYRITIPWQDEIGHVAASFNTMAERLSQRNRELVLQTQRLMEQIAEREKAADALRTSEARYRAVVQDQTECICRLLPDLTFTFVNEAFLRYFDSSAQQIIGYSLLDLIPAKWHASMLAHVAALTPENPFGTLQFEQEQHGNLRFQLWTFRASWDDRGALREIQAVGRDITDQKRAEERLAHDALHDALTGLPNRIQLIDRLSRMIDHARRNHSYAYAALFLDMDRFKIVNDTLGHLIGDQFLITAARRLVSSLRPQDTVARMGGDEFAILLEDIKEPREVTGIVERLQAVLAEPFTLNGQQLAASASIGIAFGSETFGNVYESAEDVLRDADTAMYQAKFRGTGSYAVFDRTMHHHVSGIFYLEADLRGALERNEFRLEYQPIVDAEKTTITQVEALVRWMHPQRGRVPPLEFIPLAEETGLIRPLGEWILQTACAQANEWLHQGCALRCISVNVSPIQFDSPDFVGVVRGVLQATLLPPAMLELEITESVAMRDLDQVERRMRELEALGIRISIDDFGTGYSSLSRLKRFPLRTLKIDRLFIKDLLADPDDAAITTAIIAMAHNLKLEVIAEGVETLEQVRFLKKNGCDQIQGFFFSRPKTAQDLAPMLHCAAPLMPMIDSANCVVAA